MSFSVAIVCEDHTHDQYIVRPVIAKMLAAIGRPKARLTVVNNPQLRGYEDLCKHACSILRRYGRVADIVIFAVDADLKDGKEGRPDRAASLRELLDSCERHSDRAVVIAARQEVEVWALWGSRSKLADAWTDVLRERDPKEAYFDGLTTQADARAPGRGRARLIGKSLEQGWRSLRTGCEELGDLEREVLGRLHGTD